MNRMTHTHVLPRRWLRTVALGSGLGAVLVALMALTAPARADGDPRTDDVPRIMPYEGRLEIDGRPLDAHGDDALHLEFALYDGLDALEPVYTQALRVEVYDGDFTSTIGPSGFGPDGEERGIADVIAAADDLYLGMTLLGDPEDPSDDVPLSRRQPLRATPYALWTTAATDIAVADEVQVGADITVGGALGASGLQVAGDVRLPADAIDSRVIADLSLGARHIGNTMLGNGIQRSGDSLSIDGAVVDGRTRTYMRSACHLQLGWRDNCSNCGSGPAKHVTVRADGVCTGASGSDTRCRADDTWGGVNTDGSVDGNDVFYIRMICN